ncbi:hypothetical protein HBI56_240160 [Parastagonospora nodorum]|uniref:Uncharacterized protein n=1 Tax=Phaeosphaeria nodorum (strain SN15 / ATCC MYA-4574 / FGSC 10173) TaxID=321614 RepID=A0A7U2EVQ8_PHANO|nr:hypothetical protein HBH56_247380 [Parastagonospora nodorum]QRC93983.1 hypothetical protein JI435_404910 [Parastagonospora nodorum SN15]KAH3921026.1 hypothetical protein HBH54_248280 [Parastagonospora nodorum]KAH3938531.1 hypothetical protein HBH53_251590 [Parastagonospora nodorum]KAH3956187.1 hypothetical protein HBH51_249670 [Parastagonospora nodorum]
MGSQPAARVISSLAASRSARCPPITDIQGKGVACMYREVSRCWLCVCISMLYATIVQSLTYASPLVTIRVRAVAPAISTSGFRHRYTSSLRLERSSPTSRYSSMPTIALPNP